MDINSATARATPTDQSLARSRDQEAPRNSSALFVPLAWAEQRCEVLDRITRLLTPSVADGAEIPTWAQDELRMLSLLTSEMSEESGGFRPLFAFAHKCERPSMARSFYEFLLSSDACVTHVIEANRRFPAPEEALGIAKGLLQRTPEGRALGLAILRDLCCDDTTPSSPTVIAWTGCLLRWLLERIPDTERPSVLATLPSFFSVASPSCMRMIRQFLYTMHRSPASARPSEHLLWRDMVVALSESEAPSRYAMLVGLGISRHIPRGDQDLCLDLALNRPLQGTPAFHNFLAIIRHEKDEPRRGQLASLISSIDDFAFEYWGDAAPFVFERPLRRLEQAGIDPVLFWSRICPSVSAGTFLAAFNVADGDVAVLESFDTAFRTARQSEGDQWFRMELRKSYTRCAFLHPAQHHYIVNERLPRLSLSTLEGCFDLLTVLSVAPLRQRREFPSLAMQRIRSWCGTEGIINSPNEEWVSRHYSSAEDISMATSFLSISPHLPIDDQVQLAALHGIVDWLGDSSWYPAALARLSSERWKAFAPSPLGVEVVAQFVRAQTIVGGDDTTLLLRELGEALVATDVTAQEQWKRYRYRDDDPRVARQLRSLTPDARERWKRDFGAVASVPNEEVKALGYSEFGHCLALITDWPEFMFKVGKYPIMTAACTSFDSGPFYSKGLVSYLSDAHIKVALLLDIERVVRLVAPQLPDEVRERVLNFEFGLNDLRRYAGFFSQACISRTIVKLVEDEQRRPFLLVEPSFVRGSLVKHEPNLATVRFLRNVAEDLGAGLASAPFEPPKTGPQPLFRMGSLPAKALIIPPSRSPGGQLENWDGASWLSSHYGATEVIGLEILAPS